MENYGSHFLELISTLSAVLDLDENVKLYHAWRTALVAYKIAQRVLPDEVQHVFYAGLLHDVGAIGLEDHIVHYPENSFQQQKMIFEHPRVGGEIVREIPGLEFAAELILNHHETLDGQGYPTGKKGTEIPLGSQILHIADHLDLMLRNPSLNKTDIYNAFRVKKGRKFSVELWPAFLDVISLDGGTFFQMLQDKSGYLLLMRDALREMASHELELPADFLDQVIKVFGKVIDAKHSYTQGHTERVVGYSTILATAYGLSHKETLEIQRAAYLHDVGKLGVPVRILDKIDPLTEEEFFTVKKHILLTMEVLDSMSFLRHLAEISGYHHARWDGKGYPDRIRGEEIPLGARIICIGDSFDAMTSNRAYRKAFSFERALEEVKANGGTQFDPQLVLLLNRPEVVAEFNQVYNSQFIEK